MSQGVHQTAVDKETHRRFPTSDVLQRPCVKCGVVDRNKYGNCKVCQKASSNAYRAANLQAVKAKSAAYRAINREKAIARCAAWRVANPGKANAAAARWRAANLAKEKASKAIRYAANKEKEKVKAAARYASNPSTAKAYASAWQKANPEARRIHGQNRRFRKAASGGVLSKNLSQKLFNLQKGKCACCKQALGGSYHLDHIMPLVLGGTNTDDNIQLLHQQCNNQKHAKHPIDFMQSRGFLL